MQIATQPQASTVEVVFTLSDAALELQLRLHTKVAKFMSKTSKKCW